MSMGGDWTELERPAPESATVGGVELRRGSRVRILPRAGRDIFDLALAGRTALVTGLEADLEGQVHVVVTVDDDPGRDLGEARFLGHRFFFSLDEVAPVETEGLEPPVTRRVLVAGIGNLFLGDDGFGVEVARRLAGREMPPGVNVVDFGIRGMDLAYALNDCDAAVLVDATPRGEAPGTVSLIEPDLDEDEAVVLDTHGMDPVRVLRLAQEYGGVPARTLVVGCEPYRIVDPDAGDDVLMELSAPVAAAVDEAVAMVESVVGELVAAGDGETEGQPRGGGSS